MAKTYRILVVDDEESITFLLKTELEELSDFDVDVALNGTEAINLIQSTIYDIALLDIKMPRVSGIDVLRFINEHSPATQVIMLTNIVDYKTAIETIKLGAYDFISKPYDSQQLLATVRRAVERRQLVIDKEVMKRELSRISGPSGLVGESAVFCNVVENWPTVRHLSLSRERVARERSCSHISCIMRAQDGTSLLLLSTALRFQINFSKVSFSDTRRVHLPTRTQQSRDW
jgi:DNA-binding NtrC family response regulator